MTFQSGGHQALYYEWIEGDPDKPHLVFLHEGLGCTAMWRDFPRALCRATGCPGLVYDRLGYGASPALPRPRTLSYLHQYALDELPQLLSSLIPERDYVLIGHSDGASIGLIHAAERPAQLRGLICEAAHVFVEPETLAGIADATQAFQAGKLQGLAKYHGEKTASLFRAWSDTWQSDWFRHWNIEYVLPAIACPVLVIQGLEDQYATLAQVEAIVSQVPRAQQLVVENCGHAPHLERPDELLQHMQAFIEALPAAHGNRPPPG